MQSIIALVSELVFADIVTDCVDVATQGLVYHKEGLLRVRIDEVARLVVHRVIGEADAVAAVDVQCHEAGKLFHGSSLCCTLFVVHLF